jgi:hypothetical protein
MADGALWDEFFERIRAVSGVAGLTDPDDHQRSNLKARLGVRERMAVAIFLTIKWIVERSAQ